MTKTEFYNKAFLALIPAVTQAYIVKNSLPFVEDEDGAREHFEELKTKWNRSQRRQTSSLKASI